MPVVKQPFELPAHEASREPAPYGAKRQRVFDAVLEITCVRAIRFDQMRMFPAAERSAHLHVAKLALLDVALVHSNPA